jgi:hypothetical protein
LGIFQAGICRKFHENFTTKAEEGENVYLNIMEQQHGH